MIGVDSLLRYIVCLHPIDLDKRLTLLVGIARWDLITFLLDISQGPPPPFNSLLIIACQLRILKLGLAFTKGQNKHLYFSGTICDAASLGHFVTLNCSLLSCWAPCLPSFFEAGLATFLMCDSVDEIEFSQLFLAGPGPWGTVSWLRATGSYCLSSPETTLSMTFLLILKTHSSGFPREQFSSCARHEEVTSTRSYLFEARGDSRPFVTFSDYCMFPLQQGYAYARLRYTTV
jgi:hypothetical protein